MTGFVVIFCSSNRMQTLQVPGRARSEKSRVDGRLGTGGQTFHHVTAENIEESGVLNLNTGSQVVTKGRCDQVLPNSCQLAHNFKTFRQMAHGSPFAFLPPGSAIVCKSPLEERLRTRSVVVITFRPPPAITK